MGDGARRDEDGYFWITGRVDDVINVSGHRLSTAEIESALVAHHTVAEAAVIAIADEMSGQSVVAYVTVVGEVEPGPDLATELRDYVGNRIGKFARPKRLMWTSELPKTRSGKIMRRLLRDIAEGRDLGDVTTLADPTVVSALQKSAAEERGVRNDNSNHPDQPRPQRRRPGRAPRRPGHRRHPRYRRRRQQGARQRGGVRRTGQVWAVNGGMDM